MGASEAERIKGGHLRPPACQLPPGGVRAVRASRVGVCSAMAAARGLRAAAERLRGFGAGLPGWAEGAWVAGCSPCTLQTLACSMRSAM